MSEIGEIFSALREHKKDEAEERYAETVAMLKLSKVPMVFKNRGYHVIISQHGRGVADLWPSTGRWKIRAKQQYGQGVEKLMAELGIETKS